MRIWQLQEAKAKLTELVKAALHEPQIISRHGVNEVVVINMRDYKQIFEKEEDIVSFFKHSPLFGVDLSFERDQSSPREINLNEHDEKK